MTCNVFSGTLNPTQSNLTESDKQAAVLELKSLVSDIVVNVDTHPVQASADSDSDPPPQKKLKHDGDITTSFLADLLCTTQSQNTEEVDSYLACSDKCDDVLAYRHNKQTTWPKLSECVK